MRLSAPQKEHAPLLAELKALRLKNFEHETLAAKARELSGVVRRRPPSAPRSNCSARAGARVAAAGVDARRARRAARQG